MKIGDEYHVLFECSNQTLFDLRVKFMSTVYSINPQLNALKLVDQFYYCMLAADTNLRTHVGGYLHKVQLCSAL